MTPQAKPLAAARSAGEAGNPDLMIERIGRLTRMLHDSLRDLGYDREIERAAAAIPDARDRLDYVAAMTEQAAQRTLDAIERAVPLAAGLVERARELAAEWDGTLRAGTARLDGPQLAERTRGFLEETAARAEAMRAHLLEIMMAQDFQDLTGQVIRRITEIVRDAERQLLALLVENSDRRPRPAPRVAPLAGPVIASNPGRDVLRNQNEVDALLEQLGF
jgi:chemotaxis protein CheZ